MALSMNMQEGPHSQLPASRQAHMHAHPHTHTNTHIYRHTQAHMQTIHKHMAYVHTLACTYGHIYVDTQIRAHTHHTPEYNAYMLSKQSLLGSPLLTPTLHQSI